MKKSIKICSLVCVFAMLFTPALTGCQSGTTPSSSKADSASASSAKSDAAWDTSKKDKVVISVINNYYTAGEKQLALDYMKLHPETEVVVDVVADNDSYNQKLKTTITTDINTAPDIIHGNFITGALNASWQNCYDKNYILDLTPMLDETNPYNDNKKVRDVFKANDITRSISGTGGKMGTLPFDFVGIGFFYNKTVFDKMGLTVPTSYEDLVADCKTLKEKGYKAPIAASAESTWVENMIADTAYRSIETQFLSLPGDAVYDASTMSANTKITEDQVNDPTFDLYAVMNDEKICAFVKKNGVNTALNKTVWSQFANLAQYFQQNWVSPDSAKVLTDFEGQNSPILCSGSWNVGKLVSEIGQLPTDKQFEWGTFSLPGFKNPPAGFTAPMRSLYVFGNQMGIIKKSDADHEARVKDLLKYWYSPKQAQMMYEVTLSSGNYVQGPPAIQGVTLSDENKLRLSGFISEGSVQGWGTLVGQTECLQADIPTYNNICNELTDNKITVDSFLNQLNTLVTKYNDDKIKKNGFDLDPKTKDKSQE